MLALAAFLRPIFFALMGCKLIKTFPAKLPTVGQSWMARYSCVRAIASWRGFISWRMSVRVGEGIPGTTRRGRELGRSYVCCGPQGLQGRGCETQQVAFFAGELAELLVISGKLA